MNQSTHAAMQEAIRRAKEAAETKKRTSAAAQAKPQPAPAPAPDLMSTPAPVQPVQKPTPTPQPETYTSVSDLTQAAKAGKTVSLYNLVQLQQAEKQQAAAQQVMSTEPTPEQVDAAHDKIRELFYQAYNIAVNELRRPADNAGAVLGSVFARAYGWSAQDAVNFAAAACEECNEHSAAAIIRASIA